MKTWEYNVKELDTGNTKDLINQLDEIGKLRWELVSIDSKGRFYFRRELIVPTPAEQEYSRGYI
jgi:hypothetical protein